MKTALSIALALTATPLIAQADQTENSSKAKTSVATRGHKALMFNLGGLFSSAPTAVDGVGVGGRYFLDRKMAIRAGVGFTNTSVDTDQGDNNSTDKNTAYTIEGGAEWTIGRTSNTYLYAGALAQIGLTGSDPEGSDNNTDTTSITAAGLVGATWFPVENVSVGAEYRLGMTYAKSEREAGDITQTTTTLGTGTVGFHLAFWH